MRPSGAAARVPHPHGDGNGGNRMSGALHAGDEPAYGDPSFGLEEAEPEQNDENETPRDLAALDDPAEEDDEPLELEVSTDSLQLFLKDIGNVDLLTAAQEV